MNAVPKGKMREAALKRLERLDPAAEPPPKVLDWQKKLEAASVDGETFAKVLATALQDLVCANGANAIYILRGLMRSERFAGTRCEAPELIKFIMSEKCAVSASLTANDKARLLEIKQDAEKKFAPPPTSNKEEVNRQPAPRTPAFALGASSPAHRQANCAKMKQ